MSSSQSFGKNKPRGKLRRQIASSALTNLLSGTSAVGSAALSAVGSVLPSITFETPLRPIGLYNAEREEEKRKSRKNSYSKLAQKEREESKQRQEAYINAQAKKAAQKLMKKREEKLAPINRRRNGSAGALSSITHLLPSLEPITEPTTSFSNRMNARRRERTKKAAVKVAAESRKGRNNSRRNLMVMPTENSTNGTRNRSRSRSRSSSFNTANYNASQEEGLLNGLNLSEIERIRDPRSRPNTLPTNYRPTEGNISRKHRKLLNAQRRNRYLYPNTYENNA